MGDGEGAQLSHGGGPTWEGAIRAEGGARCWEAKGVWVSGEGTRLHLGPLVARCPALKSTVPWSHVPIHTRLLVSRLVVPTPQGRDGEGTGTVSCSPGDSAWPGVLPLGAAPQTGHPTCPRWQGQGDAWLWGHANLGRVLTWPGHAGLLHGQVHRRCSELSMGR